MIAWSYGGGVQSAAIGVLIKEGVLPVPELAGICDTSREKQTTWDYLHNVMQPYLKPTGLVIEVIPHSMARVDLYERKYGRPLVPAYDAKEGRLATYCSGEWKRDVFERWLRSRGVKVCDCWIGFSVDEKEREKKDHRPWCHYKYPLIHRSITRDMCLDIIKGAGLPIPSKSRCWCCPHQTTAEWAEIRDSPEEWGKAVAMDNEIRDSDERGGLYLSSQRVPLPLMATDAAVLPARPCEGGHCWT